MQAHGFKNAELINTERIIIKLMWSTNSYEERLFQRWDESY
jgi:hypothetical protein